jgi:hypothetical protein
MEVVDGVALIGFDVPERVSDGDKLRVIAAVECRDADAATSLVALVVRDKVRHQRALLCF